MNNARRHCVNTHYLCIINKLLDFNKGIGFSNRMFQIRSEELMWKMSLCVCCKIGIICITNRVRLVKRISLRLFDPRKDLLCFVSSYNTFGLRFFYKRFLDFSHDTSLLLSNCFSKNVRFLQVKASDLLCNKDSLFLEYKNAVSVFENWL